MRIARITGSGLVLSLLLLHPGAVASAQGKPLYRAAGPRPAPPARVPTMAQVAAWAQQAASTNVDCPLSPDDAVALRAYGGRGGGFEQVVNEIGCFCSIQQTCGGYERTGCGFAEPPSRRGHPRNDGEKAVEQWAERLYAGRKAPLGKVTRAQPLPAPDRAAYLATVDEGRTLAAIRKSKAAMDEDIERKLFFSLEEYQQGVHGVLSALEKQRCGEKSETGRALVAEVDELVRAHSKEIAAEKRLEAKLDADGPYNQLIAEQKRVQTQLDEMEHSQGRAIDVCRSDRSEWKLCKAMTHRDSLGAQISARERLLAGK